MVGTACGWDGEGVGGGGWRLIIIITHWTLMEATADLCLYITLTGIEFKQHN